VYKISFVHFEYFHTDYWCILIYRVAKFLSFPWKVEVLINYIAHDILKKKNDDISPFLWCPLRITLQFSVSASRSSRVSAANKALITRYTLLLVYSLLYVLTISWCVLFHYAPSHSLSLSSFVSCRSFRSFIRPRLLCTRLLAFNGKRSRCEKRKSKFPFFFEVDFQVFAIRAILDRPGSLLRPKSIFMKSQLNALNL